MDVPIPDARRPHPPSARVVRATVAFAGVAGFTALSLEIGAERAYLAVTGCLQLLDGIARRHGGAVDKYQGDGLMVVFGHPAPLAQPARAALEAVLEMRQQVRDYDRALALPLRLAFQAGIATGPLVAGHVGGRVVREFHVLGDTVNVAARLKARAALDTIRADDETAREAGERFAWGPAAELALKGKSRAVRSSEVRGVRGPLATPGLAPEEAHAAPLIGRDSERARLDEALRALGAGGGGAVVVAGDEGSGRSRLLAELATSPALEDVAVVALRPRPGAAARPGGAARDLLAALTGAESAAGAPAELGAAIRSALADASSKRPLLVAIEDVDRLDADSCSALAPALAIAAERPLLVVLTAPLAGGPLVEAARALGSRCVEIVLGPLAPDAAERLVDAVAGDAVLPPEARALLLARAGGHPGRLVLGVHLAPALATERAQSERATRSADAERRRATILFADISGFTAMTERLGAEAAYPIVAGCLDLLDGIARDHGGHVEKHLGDCVMATFGVAETIEDAPRAAINAAIEMRARVRAYNAERGVDPPLSLHAGIHTGLGIAGDVSGPLLREFAVMGEPVDVASQLTDQAEAGQIFVGPHTERLTRGVFAFAALGPLALPGQPAPIDAFEVRSEQLQRHRKRVDEGHRVFSALVGRREELAALRERVVAVGAGRGGVVALRAEAGIGKSRLIAELAKSEEASLLTWLEGRSLSTGRGLRFHPFADLLRSWATIGDADDDAAARAKLAALVAAWLPGEIEDTTPLLANLLGLRLDDAERARFERIAGESLERLLHRAIGQLLIGASAVRPVVVVMDDLHWADESSLELLAALLPLAREHAVLFALLARPGHAETVGRIEDAARAAGLDPLILRLEPLSRTAARELLANVFETDALPHATRAAIEAKAQGNPFFLEEVVRTLVDEGAIERVDGRFRATERIHGVAIPDTLHEVVMARVDRLPAQRRSLLQLASVIGPSFHESVLVAVAGADVSDDLRALAGSDFVRPWDQTRGVEWAFAHPLLHEVTYDGLLQTRREELHRQVARVIDAQLADDVPGRAGMLAWHYGKGRDVERAEEFLFRAGEDAARVAASSEALRFFEESWKLYAELHGDGGDPKKKARLAHHVALALFHRGRLLEADEYYQQALEHLGVRVPRGTGRMAAAFLGDALAVLAHVVANERSASRPARDVDRQIIAIMYQRAQTQTTASPTRFVFDSVATLARLGRIDPSTVPGAGGMYAGAVGIFSYGGVSFGLGRRFLARARQLVRPDDVPDRVHYQMMNQLHHVLAGDWSDAHVVDDALLEDGLRYGRLWEVTNALNLDGLRQLYRGAWNAAAICAERLAKIAEQYRYDLAASAQRFLLAMLRLERRDLAGAIAALDEYLDEHAEPAFQISALGHRAVAQWLGGDADGARASLARAEQRLAGAERLLPYHAADFLRARQLLDTARLEEPGAGRADRRRTARSRRAALRVAARVAWRRPEVLRSAGTEAWLVGRHNLARRRWNESLECAAALGMRPERARTQHEMGRRLSAGGERDEATALLAGARDEFAALGLAAEHASAAALCERA